MLNIVELVDDEQQQAPCKYGNIVVGHACYCHRDDWEEGPRKCPIYREWGLSDLSRWRKVDKWPTHKLPMFKGYRYNDEGKEISVLSEMEDMPYMPDDGGCPMFEPAE